MTSDFSIADFTDDEYKQNIEKAYQYYNEGYPPNFSTGICESLTSGYGRLDCYGYWEYPLYVDQDSWEIINGEKYDS